MQEHSGEEMVPPRDEPPSDSRPPEEFAETHVVSHKANASTCRRSGAPSIGLDQAASYSSAEAAVMVHSFSRMAAVAWDWRLRVHLTLQGKQRGGGSVHLPGACTPGGSHIGLLSNVDSRCGSQAQAVVVMVAACRKAPGRLGSCASAWEHEAAAASVPGQGGT